MKNNGIKTPLTLDDICSFYLFKLNNASFKQNSEEIEENISDEKEKDQQSEQNEDEEEKNDEIDKEKGTEEGEETEEEKNAMKKLRSFPNVAISRFSGQNQYKPQLIENSIQADIKQENKHKSIPTNNPRNFTQSFNHFNQYNPNHLTLSTFNSSMNYSSMMYSKDTIHHSMPIRPVSFPYSQYAFQNIPQSRSFPFQVGYNQYPIKYYNPQMPIMNSNPNNQNINNSLQVNQTEMKKNKKLSIIENYNTLEELLASLKNGKQIGNYIKSRDNSGTMVSLIKKLPPNKIGELIEMIKPKLKEIMITNNKFAQKLFEQCTAEQRLQILKTIQNNFIEIALNKWGSYSLQALIKVVSLPEEQEIVKNCIEGKVYELAMDKQANFVLQKIILLFNDKGTSSITDEIFDIFHHLIYNSSGITLLKNLILTNKGSNTRKKFVLKLIENLDNIINNSTGHSLILQMLDRWDYETGKGMIMEIIKNIQKYALMKYSSIVVLKCVCMSDITVIKSMYPTLFRSELVFQLMKTETGKVIIKELFNKLITKKRRVEAFALLESTVALSKEKNGTASILDYVKELIRDDIE